MDAIKNPAAEHMQIYAGLGLALAVIAGIVYMALGKSDEGLKVTLDDVASDEKPKKKGKAVKAKKEAAKPKEEEDWEDEEPLDKDALFEELDKAGPFVKTLQGTLEPKDMVTLKKLIGKYAYISFKEKKEELMLQRIEFFKQKKMKEYGQIIVTASKMFQTANFEATKLAAEFIELDEENFEASMRQAAADPECAKMMHENDENVRLLVEPVTDKLTKEKAKQILMEKTQMEFDAEKKLSNYQAKSQEEARAIVMVERTKVMD